MKISEFYKYSWFSDLSYVKWNSTNTQTADHIIATAASKDAERVPVYLGQKIFLATNENFSVLSFQENDPVGFAASLYGNGSEKVLAIRGTEPVIPDLTQADLYEIGKYGVSISQAVSLFNYILKLTAPVTADVLQLKLHIETVPIGNAAPVAGDHIEVSGVPMLLPTPFVGTMYVWLEADVSKGEGIQITSTDNITLTGHSLGGHLAAFAQRLFPSLFDQTVTYNAPGFDPPSSLHLSDELVDLFRPYLSALGLPPPAESFTALKDRLYTMEGESTVPGDDGDFVAGGGTGTPATLETFITTEKNSHSISQLVDTLGVQSLLERMSPALGLAETGLLLQSASSNAGLSEEALVNALSVLLLEGDEAAPIMNGEVAANLYEPSPFDARSSLHTRLVALEEQIQAKTDAGVTVTLVSLANLSADVITTRAATDIAYRYALTNLNPFAVTGDVSLYAPHNTNGELDLINSATGQGTLSLQYLADRAEMLYWKLQVATADALANGTNPYTGTGIPDVDLQDRTSGLYLSLGDPDGGYEDRRRIIFGGEQADMLIGANKDDRLYGGGGDDIFSGDLGNDYLEGGKGRDTLSGGSGDDTFVVIGTDAAYDLFDGGTDIDTILGGDGDDTIRLHEFNPTHSVEFIDGHGGNNTIAGTDAGDTIDLSRTVVLNVDQIAGGGGDDRISGSAGNDAITGGSGNDTLRGGLGADTYVYAPGDGADIIIDSENSATGYNRIVVAGFDLSEVQANFLFTTARGLSLFTDVAHGLTFAWDRVRQTLQITGSALNVAGNAPSAENSITVTNIDSLAALQERFGIDLPLDFKSALVTDSTNLFSNPNYVPTDGTATMQEWSGQRLNLALNQPLKAGDTITLTIDGIDGMTPNQLNLVTGDQQLGFDSGSITLTATEAQTFLSLAILEQGDIPADASVTFKATVHSAAADGTTQASESNLFTLNIVDQGAPAPVNSDFFKEGDDSDNLLKKTATGNWTILGHGGDDTIDDGSFFEVGDDYKNGGAGSDMVHGRSGNDIVIGGSGQDLLDGCLGDDFVYADEQITMAAALAQAEAVASNLKGDWLDGGDGNDSLIGGVGNDVLNGGRNNDLILGGAGDDNINGDMKFVHFTRDWEATRSLTNTTGVDDYQIIYSEVVVETPEDGGNDTIFAGGGADWVFGMTGDDFIDGGTGDDVLFGGGGCDLLLGGDGNDILSGNGSTLAEGQSDVDFLDGGGGNDKLYGADGADTLYGGAGDDLLYGDSSSQPVAADDYLHGEAGNDTLWGGGGNDTLFGGADNDTLDGNDGDDVLDGGAGTDLLYGGNGNDTLFGGDGIDTLNGNTGNDFLDGGDDNDTLVGAEGADTLLGGAGDDVLAGDASNILLEQHGADYLDGGLGNDNLNGGGGDDILLGSDGDDRLWGEAGNDLLQGDGGNDQLVGGAGDDILRGGAGRDTIFGQDDNDTLAGGVENDQLVGGLGDDNLAGDDGNDNLWGEGGNDILDGGFGTDSLEGGAGNDTYVFKRGDSAIDTANQVDYIVDLEGNNTLRFDATISRADLFVAGVGGESILLSYSADDYLLLTGGLKGTLNNLIIGEQTYTLGEIINETLADSVNLTGTGDGDFLYGGLADDTLNGGAGDDFLSGGDGNDLLIAGGGNDFAAGGGGWDTYGYQSGDGRLRIVDTGSNTLSFGVGIAAGDISLGLGSLLLRTGVAGDEIHIENFNPADPFGSVAIDRFEFADGSVLSYEELLARGFDIAGGDGNDLLTGTGTVDRISGGAGDDLLNGGAGDDLLRGEDGHDTYLFGKSSGQVVIADNPTIAATSLADRIRFSDGITPDDLRLVSAGEDLLISVAGAPGSLLIKNALQGDLANQIERFDFDSAPSWDLAMISAAIDKNTPPTITHPVTLGSIFEDGSLMVTAAALLATASDVDGDSLAVLDLTADGGSIIDNGDGTWTYRPDADAHGTVNFNYAVSDGSAAVAATATLEITAVNDAPVVGNPVVLGTILEDGSRLLTAAELLAHASDIDGDSLAVVNLTADRGSVVANGDGSWRFTPAADYNGPVSLAYQVTDGSVSMATSAGLEVTAVNDAPTVSAPVSLGSLAAANSLTITAAQLLSSAADVDGDLLAVSALTADIGTLSDNGNGSWTYLPDTGFSGAVTFSYQVSDGQVSLATTAGLTVENNVGSTLLGDRRNNTLRGGDGDDTLLGLGGNDTLRGLAGNDILVGGSGHDTLYGGAGDDLFRFNRGDGHDTIKLDDASGNDILAFGDRITVDDLKLKRTGHDLVIEVGKKRGDQVEIDDWFKPGAGEKRLDSFAFADGTNLTWDELRTQVPDHGGTTGHLLADAEFEGILQHLSAYAVKDGGFAFTTPDSGRYDHLLTLTTASWHEG